MSGGGGGRGSQGFEFGFLINFMRCFHTNGDIEKTKSHE